MSPRARLVAALLAATLLVPTAGAVAAVDWPPSPDVVVGEVVTGGATGSDEYVELYNAGDAPVELGGLELVYVTASGSTATRKHAWTDRRMRPGGQLLLANADGSFASIADHTYTGGFAAAGGTLVLRVIGGSPVDTLSWGNAASTFVEGAPGAAPAPGESLARKPGGDQGNKRDTNDNSADTIIETMPIPEGEGAAPPDPTPEPDPTERPEPDPTTTPEPDPTATPEPEPDPTPEPEPDPTARPEPDPTSTPEPDPTPTLQPEPDPTPTASPAATSTPNVTPTPMPTATPRPSATPRPTATPRPSATPKPTASPRPSATPKPSPSPTQAPIPIPIRDARAAAVGQTVTITGTVTVEPGRILGKDVIVLQDGTGGVAVKVPAGSADGDVARGRVVTTTGELAAPYGNLEVRPRKRDDLASIGQGGLPEPATISTGDLGEAIEGRLVEITGTIVTVDRGSGGTLTVTVADRDGEGRVHLHGPLGDTGSDLARGQSVRFTGIAGQRASRSGASDGYRVWPRDDADIKILSRPPQATARPGEPGDPKPPKGGKRPRRVRIADAAFGEEVTIVGTVTSPPGLLDSEGRRVTVEDGSGGILVRLPAEGAAPQPGRRIQVSGEIGTWYDAPQLEAAAPPRARERREVKPAVLRRAPTAGDESRLVAVVVRIENVTRDGDTWRAEATLGAGGALPIAGLAGSGIPSTALPEGRAATITGIVRRAHPAATDQRYALVPRSKDDIRLGAATAAEGDDDARDGDGRDGRGQAGGDSTGGGGGTSGDDDEAPEAATFATLAEHADRVVRVGGRLERSEGSRLHLHDGTGSGIVRLPDDSLEFVSSLVVGEVVNVTGRVREREDEPLEVVARSLADIQRAASLPEAGVDADPPVGARMAPVSAELTDDPADAIDSVLGSARTRTEVPVPVLAALVAGLLAGIGGIVGGTGYVLWRRRSTSRAVAPSGPTPLGR